MFDQTFVDGAGKTNKSWTVAISFALEFAAMGFLILVPLIWTEVLPRAQSVNSLTAPAPPPAPLPPAPAPEVRQSVRIVPRVFNRQLLEVPRLVPRQAAIFSDDAVPPAASLVDDAGLLGTGFPGAGLPGTAAIFTNKIGVGNPPAPAPPKPNAKPQQEGPVPVGGNVQNAKLLKHPSPTYPAIAKAARIQGAVVLQAIIGKDGAVRNLKVTSAASPLLVPSAMDAVKQWVYRPTLLNQEPVEVITEITIVFSLQ
ncbi:MAG TPA: energy transducer TonB [Bryobacteraceae bacterium]|jgi:protein TonB